MPWQMSQQTMITRRERNLHFHFYLSNLVLERAIDNQPKVLNKRLAEGILLKTKALIILFKGSSLVFFS